MKASLRNVLAATLLLAPLSSALAQSTVNQRLPLSSGGRVELGNIAGSVTVRGWDRNEVQVTGQLGRSVERVDVESSG